METLIASLQSLLADIVHEAYGVKIDPEVLSIQETRKDFEGDVTVVTFPLTKYKLGAPPAIGQKLGERLVESVSWIESFNVIKGFLNVVLSPDYWYKFLETAIQDPAFFSREEGQGQKVVVEFCSPNTNKPLHLGHLRNIILGDSLTRILKANGFEVHPTCLFNDRGTNISKSMHAWLQSADRKTPETSGEKGDKLVGDYYVSYARMLEKEVAELMESGMSKEEAVAEAPSTEAIRVLTRKWEAEDPEVRALWEKMNGWVYAAMEKTFGRLGVHFDHYFYESKVYQLGKETVAEGLEKGIFFKKEDGSIWVDLTEAGLDQKLLLRKDGTSIYITQDLAVADAKYERYQMDRSIYVVGNEQDYHFKVLFLILDKLGKSYAQGLYHLSYGMVDLPSGKMKSREGTTVEADDLMDEMEATARAVTQELGKTEGMDEAALHHLYRVIGQGALKFFLVKVDPKKRMLFNPEESVDIHGHTGPFIQYAYTRTAALQRKSGDMPAFAATMQPEDALHENERFLMRRLAQYRQVLKESADTYNPALIANYAYELAKDYNRFYHGDKIIQSAKPHTSAFRQSLSTLTGHTLKAAMGLLGIEMPERM